jgi:hypothetical protein
MLYTYVEAISIAFPSVQCHSIGDGSVYTDIVWDAGDPVPTQAILDAWITANPKPDTLMTITKYEFRKLFTLTERIAIDGAPSNPNIPANYRAMLLTMNKDLELSSEIVLNNPDVAAGVNFLEQLGLIDVGRASRVLANLPPL